MGFLKTPQMVLMHNQGRNTHLSGTLSGFKNTVREKMGQKRKGEQKLTNKSKDNGMCFAYVKSSPEQCAR